MDLRLAPPDPTQTAAAPHADRVLVVDDDELILKALARILESAGFEPRCYLSPGEALEGVERDAPAVIISDYMMPSMDGIM